MKKKIIGISLLCILIIIIGIIGIKLANKKDYKNNENIDTIKVAEVTHSAFYTPFYVAIQKGYFKDNNIDIDLILTSGANNVIAAVLSGDVQIGFCGPEAQQVVSGGHSHAVIDKLEVLDIVIEEEVRDIRVGEEQRFHLLPEPAQAEHAGERVMVHQLLQSLFLLHAERAMPQNRDGNQGNKEQGR